MPRIGQGQQKTCRALDRGSMANLTDHTRVLVDRRVRSRAHEAPVGGLLDSRPAEILESAHPAPQSAAITITITTITTTSSSTTNHPHTCMSIN